MQSALSKQEASDDLRAIRKAAEHSHRFSNFAGVSGIAGGLIALIGLATETRRTNAGGPFILHWSIIIAIALAFDFLWTRRRVRTEDKTVVKRLAQRMALAALPGLGAGLLMTLAFVSLGRASELFPYWILAYGVSMSAVGLMAPMETTWLARAFLLVGAISLGLQCEGFRPAGMLGFAACFGLFHIVYGVVVGVRDSW